MGAENSETRRRLIAIAERLMLEEGYAAVGIRRVAREAGVAPALVLYYFRTLDDLFIAMLRHGAEEETERQRSIADADDPLRALWDLANRPGAARITEEFMALGNHRKAIRAEVVAQAERYRRAQVESLSRAQAEGRLRLHGVDPLAAVVMSTALSRILVMEREMGLTLGHEATETLVGELLAHLAPEAGPA